MKKLLFLLLVIESTLSIDAFSQAGVKNGSVAPNFSGKDQNGDVVSLKQLKGKKVVL